MMNYLHIKTFYLTLIISLIGFNEVSCKSLNAGREGGHEEDIYLALPFERSEQITNLIYTIHRNIDHPIGYFKGLRDHPHQDFSWRKHGHRIFFHWGFNTDPRKSEPLQQMVDECNWSQEVEELFWEKVIVEQGRRNRETMAIVGKTLGFSTSGRERAYSNAFASLITDIHILGDYSTVNISMLPKLDLIAYDIGRALFNNLRGGDEAKRINKLLDQTALISNPHDRAEEMLKILHQNLPSFFHVIQDGFFIKHFKKLGLPIKPHKESMH